MSRQMIQLPLKNVKKILKYVLDSASKMRDQAFFGPDSVNYLNSPQKFKEEEKEEMIQLELKLNSVNFNSDLNFNHKNE